MRYLNQKAKDGRIIQGIVGHMPQAYAHHRPLLCKPGDVRGDHWVYDRSPHLLLQEHEDLKDLSPQYTLVAWELERVAWYHLKRYMVQYVCPKDSSPNKHPPAAIFRLESSICTQALGRGTDAVVALRLQSAAQLRLMSCRFAVHKKD